jgi:hypothetical protein
VVFLAVHEGSSQKIALKILPERLGKDPEWVRRFEREARVCASLNHPNIVKGYGHGSIAGRLYYAMEHVEGRLVGRLIREKKRLSEAEALDIAIQMALALDEIHKAGLVHRDLKPDNIIIASDTVAKLMDLGLVKAFHGEDTALTQTGDALGTPHYMSPEQIEGKPTDIRSDIYSLGATLYHMVTGVVPFRGASAIEVVNKQLAHDLEDPKDHCPTISGPLHQAILRMMARKPEFRLGPPALLISALYQVLDGRMPVEERLMEVRTFTRAPSAAAADTAPAEEILQGLPGKDTARRVATARYLPGRFAAKPVGGVQSQHVLLRVILGTAAFAALIAVTVCVFFDLPGGSAALAPPLAVAVGLGIAGGVIGGVVLWMRRGEGRGFAVLDEPPPTFLDNLLSASDFSKMIGGKAALRMSYERYGSWHVFSAGGSPSLEVAVKRCAAGGSVRDFEVEREADEGHVARHRASDAAVAAEAGPVPSLGKASWYSFLLKAGTSRRVRGRLVCVQGDFLFRITWRERAGSSQHTSASAAPILERLRRCAATVSDRLRAHPSAAP